MPFASMSFVKSVTPIACTISTSDAIPDTTARILRQTGSFFIICASFSGAGGMRWYSGSTGSGSSTPPQAIITSSGVTASGRMSRAMRFAAVV